MGRQLISTRKVIVVYRLDLSPYGIFVNAYHLEANIGIRNANIGKYLNFLMFSLGEFIAVEVDVGNEGITDRLFEMGIEDAKKRQAMSDINHLTVKRMAKLRPDQIMAINKIINDENH